MNHRIFDDEQINKLNETCKPIADEINSREWKNRNSVWAKRFRDNRPKLDWEEIQMIKQFYRQCPNGYEVDHIIPLTKGGKHCLANMQWLTKKENMNKSEKITFDVEEFPKCLLIKNF